MLRLVEQQLHWRALHDAAGVHHHHLVGDLSDNAQVVGDEHDGGSCFLLQCPHQRQDLGLDGHIQRRGGLISNQQTRIAGKTHGDHHALTHATAELVREFFQPLLGCGDTNLAQHINGARASLGARKSPVPHQTFHDLVAHSEGRVERCHGLLEDHRHAVATQVLHVVFRQANQFPTFKSYRTRSYSPVGFGKQAHDRQRSDTFAASRFTDDRQCLSGVHCEVHLLEDGDLAIVGSEHRRQTADLKQCGCRCSVSPSHAHSVTRAAA